MCQRLYIASFKPIGGVSRSKAAPYLELWRAGKQHETVRRHFPVGEFPMLYVAAGYSPCGCGFPEGLPGDRDRRKDQPEERATMARLVEALRPVVTSRPRVQLYLCFIGHEGERPEGRRSVTLGDIADPSFRFQDLEVVTVVKGGVEQRVAPDGRRWHTGRRPQVNAGVGRT